MTSDQVCEFLDISPKTLITYERELGLPSHRMHTGARAPKRYFLSEVSDWLRSRCSRPAPAQTSTARAEDRDPAGAAIAESVDPARSWNR